VALLVSNLLIQFISFGFIYLFYLFLFCIFILFYIYFLYFFLVFLHLVPVFTCVDLGGV